jgi:hypothetical protein
VTTGGQSQLALLAFVSGTMFGALEVPAHAGRILLPSDDTGPGRPIAAVLAFDFWSSPAIRR